MITVVHSRANVYSATNAKHVRLGVVAFHVRIYARARPAPVRMRAGCTYGCGHGGGFREACG